LKIKNKSILVTGGGGFIGYHLIKKLLEKNCNITIFDKDLSHKAGSNIFRKCKYIQGDITKNKDLLKLGIKYDCIFHLASNASVPESVDNPEMDFMINAQGTLMVLEFARKMKIKKVVYTSTVSVFDRYNIQPISETSQIKVSSPYGASKLAGESYCYAYHRTYGINTNIVRLFNVYGPGMRKHFIYDMINKINDADERIEIMGNGKQVRDYLYIDDVVDGILLITEKGAIGEDYNLSSGIKTRIVDIVSILIKLMGKSHLNVITTNKTWAGDILEWYADISKIKKLGFEPKISLQKGLKQTIKDILNNE